MPSPHSPEKKAQKTFAAYLQSIDHLPLLDEAYHIRMLALGLAKEYQQKIIEKWADPDRQHQLYKELLPYKRARVRHEELKKISAHILKQMQSLVLDVDDETISQQMQAVIRQACRQLQAKPCLVTFNRYQQESTRWIHSLHEPNPTPATLLAASSHKWQALRNYVEQQRRFKEYCYENAWMIYVIVIMAMPLLLSVGYGVFYDINTAWRAFLEMAETDVRLLPFDLMHLIALSYLGIRYYNQEQSLPTLSLDDTTLEPILIKSLQQHLQENTQTLQAYPDLMTLSHASIPVALNPVAQEEKKAENRYHDIHDRANDYLQLSNQAYLRFNRVDLAHLHPNKKTSKRDNEHFYELLQKERMCQDVTMKENRSLHSPFRGMNAKLKSTEPLLPYLALKIRPPTETERALGITTDVYSPKAIVQYHKRQ